MSDAVSNPYTAPTANLNAPLNNGKLKQLPRFSAWWVFLLNIVTLGIYPLWWLYSRASTLNQIQSRPIALELIYVLVVVLLGSFALGFVAGFSGEEYAVIENSLSIAYWVLYLITAFTIRNRLHDVFIEEGHHVRTGPILTFFFSSIYLQYKINEAIDTTSNR